MGRKSKQGQTVEQEQEQEQDATHEEVAETVAKIDAMLAEDEAIEVAAEAKPVKAPKPLPSEEAEVARLNGKYAGAQVLSVVEWGKKGATRVKIGCSVEGCGQAREIAVQDAFQVRRCVTHQKSVGRKGRSAKRAAVVASLKAEVERLRSALDQYEPDGAVEVAAE